MYQNVAQPIFVKLNMYTTFTAERFGLPTSVIVKQLTKVNNRPKGEKLPKRRKIAQKAKNRPKGDNSANMVTLVVHN
jgi:hypothetical protein